MGLLDDVRTHLINQSVANTTTWKAFVGYTPDEADQVISLNPTGGRPQDTHGGENAHDTFQVRIRAAKFEYTICEAKWWDMFDALQDADLSSVSGADVYLMQCENVGPLHYVDDKQRPNCTANFRVIRAKP